MTTPVLIRIDQCIHLSGQPWQIYMYTAGLQDGQELVTTFVMPLTVESFTALLRQIATEIDNNTLKFKKRNIGTAILMGTNLENPT